MDYKNSQYLIEIFDFDVLHLELNTALYTFVLVLVVMFFMNRLLFRPVLRTLENRARAAQSLQEATAGHREEIARLAEDYDARLSHVRGEVAIIRQESHREIQQAVDAILEQARQASQAEFRSALEELTRQIELARVELGASAQRLAEQAANRILQA